MSKQLARRERLGEERLGDDAFLVTRMEVALLRVRKAAALAGSGVPAGVAAGTALLDSLKTELAEGRELLERLGGGGAEPAVPAAYHRAAAEYYKIRGPAAAFYEAALAYLGVTPLSALSPEERVAMAIDVALAALVGEGVYNFGEVSPHNKVLLLMLLLLLACPTPALREPMVATQDAPTRFVQLSNPLLALHRHRHALLVRTAIRLP